MATSRIWTQPRTETSQSAMTRRALIATSVGACAAGTAWQQATADEFKEFSFVIVSDTHLGRQDKTTSELQWRQAITEINATPGDFVLHLGDIVDSGRPSQYPIYIDSRKELKKPIYEVPGNHDPQDLFEKHIRTSIDIAFDHSGVRFLLLGNSHVDSHLGFISPPQLDWLTKECLVAEEKNLRIVLACHVPIHKNLSPDRGWYVKPEDGQTAFYQLLERYSQRFLVCFHGHFHNGIRGWRDHAQVVETLCPSICYNQNRNLAAAIKEQKASGFFVDELRPGYVLVTIGPEKLAMRYKPLGSTINGEYAATWG